MTQFGLGIWAVSLLGLRQCFFELKLDGFRGLADTMNGRMPSKNRNRPKRFQHLLDALPPNCVFDREICALDADGRPVFKDLMFGRREPFMSPSMCWLPMGECNRPTAKRSESTTHPDRPTLPAPEARLGHRGRQSGIPGSM